MADTDKKELAPCDHKVIDKEECRLGQMVRCGHCVYYTTNIQDELKEIEEWNRMMMN